MWKKISPSIFRRVRILLVLVYSSQGLGAGVVSVPVSEMCGKLGIDISARSGASWEPSWPLDCLSAAITARVIDSRGKFWAVGPGETQFASVADVWVAMGGEAAWREQVRAYWASQAPTVSSVFGEQATEHGFDSAEIAQSRTVLSRTLELRSMSLAMSSGTPPPAVNAKTRCISIASGIGREAADVLAKQCDSVDLVEPQSHFLATAKQAMAAVGVGGNAYNLDIEDFVFDDEGYDIVWLQWGSVCLSDEALVRFFQKCTDALLLRVTRGYPPGILVLKDNLSEYADAVFGGDANMIVRSQAYLEAIVDLAVTRRHSPTQVTGDIKNGKSFLYGDVGLHLLWAERQDPWDEGLFPAYYFIFAPAEKEGYLEGATGTGPSDGASELSDSRAEL